MRAALSDISEEDRCEPCGGKRSPCQSCSNMKNTSTFKGKYSNKVYQIKKKFNCNFKMVVNLIECSVCRKQYKSTTVTKLSTRAITIKAHIVIFGMDKNCQTKPVTRNTIANIVWRMTITGYMTRRSQ